MDKCEEMVVALEGDDRSPLTDRELQALRNMGNEAEAAAQEIESLRHEASFYRRRCEALQAWQSGMRDPERAVVCDILANGHTLAPAYAGDRYQVKPDNDVNSPGAFPMPEHSRLRLKALQSAADILAQAQAFDVLKHVQHALECELRAPGRPSDHEGARYFRSVFTVEVLSEDEPMPSDMPLPEIGAAISYGDCTGLVTFEGASELDAQQMREAVQAVGSSPDFFQSLVEEEMSAGTDDSAAPSFRAREGAG